MSAEKKDILIVEDNLDLSTIYRIAFEAGGYTVRLSLNGMDGIVKSLEKKPDVILLDIMMPDMDGFEVLKALRQNSSMDVVIIINSNLSQQKDIDLALKLGANAYLQKSNFSPAELIREVEKIITAKNVKTDPSASGTKEKLEEDVLGLFFSQDILRIFTVQQVNNDEAGSTILLEEKNISPVWNGKKSSIGGFLPSETITGLTLGEKPLSLIVQRHIWQIEGENTTVKYDIAVQNNAIVFSVKEIL